jgi:hypothetical protein
MIVTAFQVNSNIDLIGSDLLPGIHMGDIDHESRREDHINNGDYCAPSLLPHLFVNLSSNLAFMSLLQKCSPFHALQYRVNDFHAIYNDILTYLR